jgi:hypothetical protein
MNLGKTSNFTVKNVGDKFIKLFLIGMVFELAIGGGGRFFEIGPITVRMLFYLLAFPISIVLIVLAKKIKEYVFVSTVVYTLLLSIGILVGIINHNPIDLILEDIKPLSFFYVLPFFAGAIRNVEDVKLMIRVIKASSIILASGYILLLSLIVTQIVNFSRFYAMMEPYGEVMFRGETFFFYKGFLFLCIGFFFTLQPGRLNRFFAVLLLTAIILTLTRGFILMVLVVSVFYLMFIYKNKLISALLLLGTFITFLAALPFYLESVGDRSDSDMIRIFAVQQVREKTNPVNFFIGDGFGRGIPIRPIHMEISFLEIFSKQGVCGIMFWLVLLFYISYKFFNSNEPKEHKTLLAPFYLSVIFVYLQSLTNPFLNNPIGMSIVLISLVVLHIKST